MLPRAWETPSHNATPQAEFGAGRSLAVRCGAMPLLRGLGGSRDSWGSALCRGGGGASSRRLSARHRVRVVGQAWRAAFVLPCPRPLLQADLRERGSELWGWIFAY